ncbi:MAG TPA: hypothetical protein VEQ16_09015 [Acidocella sp.]|nr:hypothetical protein [Acidocella sp.]
MPSAIIHRPETQEWARAFGAINAENLVRTHKLFESGRSKGKIVLEGF